MIFSLVSIITTILLIVLVSINVIKKTWYPLTIYFIALANLYTTTLIGQSVVGIDISRELLMSNLALQNGWDLSIYDISNTSVVVGWLVPQLSVMLQTPPEWIYKTILPAIFALTPVILYVVFEKQIGQLKAFFASIFFIIMPVFSLEIGSIGKSMVAETLMALCLWIMITNMKWWLKLMLLALVTLLTLWSHYTVGILLVYYLTAIVFILLFIKLFKKWKLWSRRSTPIWMFIVVIVISAIGFVGYFSKASDGMVYNTVARLGEQYKNLTSSFIKHPEPIVISGNASTETKQEVQLRDLAVKARDLDPLTGIGLGKDFENASVMGRIFRLIQYFTQLLIVIGTFWLIFKYRQYNFNAEFIAGIAASFVILLLVVAMPMFSSLINATRNYQLSLFFLAPMFVLGIDALCGVKKND